VVRHEHGLDLLGVERLGARREPDQIGEQDAHDLALFHGSATHESPSLRRCSDPEAVRAARPLGETMPIMRSLRTERERYLFGARHPRARHVWRWVTAPPRRLRDRRERALAAAFVARFGTSVRTGPFAGLDCSTIANPPSYRLVRWLIGSFEEELHPALTEVLDRGYDAAVNIGCSNGYYAGGLALASPEATVYAFESSASRRGRARELARQNGFADRVHVYGTCDAAALRELAVSAPFVLCDCEGCEVDVLDPAAAPILRDAKLVVELHDDLRPRATETLLERFAGSHDATLIDSRPRDPADYAELRDFPIGEAERAVTERPGPMRWAYLMPRQRGSQRTRSTG
jgi:hypothetical protein